jgi:dihydrofolate synthase/folylpolyglutamate synthase
LAKKQGIHGEVFTTVKDAYIKALKDADKDDFVFVGGSSYVVADLLTFLSK